MDFLLVLLMLLNLENLTAFNGSMYVRFFCIKPNLNFGRQVFGLVGEKFQANSKQLLLFSLSLSVTRV